MSVNDNFASINMQTHSMQDICIYVCICVCVCVCVRARICLRNKNDKFEIANIYIYSKSAVHKTIEAFGLSFSLT